MLNPFYFPWTKLGLLALESSEVIGLRLMKLTAGGNDAQQEAHLMIREKMDAAMEASTDMLTGSTALNIVDRYREHVAANAKRLSEE